MRIAHIINPVVVPPESDLYAAQPVTFETMRRARDYAAGQVEVGLYTAQFPEDNAIIPADFTKTPNLERSVLDFGDFQKKRKLPLLRDILHRLYEASDAEFFVYTNVDIALMPSFYLTIATLLQRGLDALVINRRTISKEFTRLEDIPLMFAQVGEKHKGRDCFVWRRSVFPQFQMENACIGSDGIGKVLLINLVATATHFQEFQDFHLTFHIGNDRVWNSPDQDDLRAFNIGQLKKVVDHYRSRGTLPDHPLINIFIERRGL